MLICQNSEINVLVDLLRKDEVVAVPTDTVFGVCARYDHIQAQENLRDLKKRPETKAFPIMCADMEQVLQICEMCGEEKRVMNQFMPGPLTMILKKKKGVPSFVNGEGYDCDSSSDESYLSRNDWKAWCSCLYDERKCIR